MILSRSLSDLQQSRSNHHFSIPRKYLHVFQHR